MFNVGTHTFIEDVGNLSDAKTGLFKFSRRQDKISPRQIQCLEVHHFILELGDIFFIYRHQFWVAQRLLINAVINAPRIDADKMLDSFDKIRQISHGIWDINYFAVANEFSKDIFFVFVF